MALYHVTLHVVDKSYGSDRKQTSRTFLYDSSPLKTALRIDKSAQFFVEGISGERCLARVIAGIPSLYNGFQIVSHDSTELTGNAAAKLSEEMMWLGAKPRWIAGDKGKKLEQLCIEAGIIEEQVA